MATTEIQQETKIIGLGEKYRRNIEIVGFTLRNKLKEHKYVFGTDKERQLRASSTSLLHSQAPEGCIFKTNVVF